MQILASDLSRHIMRRLLSYLNHQAVAVWRPDLSYEWNVVSRSQVGRRVHETVQNSPYMAVRQCIADFGIRSINKHHEASTELSEPSGGGSMASKSILPVCERPLCGGSETVKISPVHGCMMIFCGFWCRTRENISIPSRNINWWLQTSYWARI